MMPPSALSYPPYLEALAAERLVRDAAVLGAKESVAGFEVLPLSLWHLTVLQIMRHPVLTGATPTPDQLRDFLWLMSPDYSPDDARGKNRLTRRCKKLFYPPRYLALFNTRRARTRHDFKRLHRLAKAAQVFESAKAFVAEAMQDQPATKQVKGFQPDYYSSGVAFCASFARELHYSREEVLHMPLKCLFQHLNEMKAFHGSKTPLCNPSDAVKAEFYREINRSLSAGRRERNATLRELTLKLREERRSRKRK